MRDLDELVAAFLASEARDRAAFDRMVAAAEGCEEIHEGFLHAYAVALEHPDPEWRSHVAWAAVGYDVHQERLSRLVAAAAERELDAEQKNFMLVAVDTMASFARDRAAALLHDALANLDRTQLGWSIIQAAIVARGAPLSTAEQGELELAIAFLDLYGRWNEIGPDAALARLRAFERRLPDLEPFFAVIDEYRECQGVRLLEPMLAAYITSSQLAWHWYGFDEAEPHLLRSLELVSTLDDDPDAPLVGRRYLIGVLSEEYDENEYCHHYYNDARLHHVSHYWLGSLYERRGALEQAATHYERFVELEPEFAPRNEIVLDGSYAHREYIPSTVEALARAGRIHLTRGDEARARACFARACALPFTHQTPAGEYAALLYRAGEVAAALDVEARYLLELLTYQRLARIDTSKADPLLPSYLRGLTVAEPSVDEHLRHVRVVARYLAERGAALGEALRVTVAEALIVYGDRLQELGFTAVLAELNERC